MKESKIYQIIEVIMIWITGLVLIIKDSNSFLSGIGTGMIIMGIVSTIILENKEEK